MLRSRCWNRLMWAISLNLKWSFFKRKQNWIPHVVASENITWTRMHSSRMRTGRSLTVWRGGLPAGGSLPAGGGSPCWGGSPCRGGLLARGGSLPGGVSLPGGSPCRGVLPTGDPPMNRMTNRCINITLATTSLRPGNEIWGTISLAVWNPLPNYVADGRASPATFSSTRV